MDYLVPADQLGIPDLKGWKVRKDQAAHLEPRVLKARQAVPDYLVNPELREVLDKTATLARWEMSALRVKPEVKEFLDLTAV